MSTSSTLSREAADEIINELLCRGGFDAWWYEIDDHTRAEIRSVMADTIEAYTDGQQS